jgi:hypothetical protein
MKDKYTAPAITSEELEKSDVLCDSQPYKKNGDYNIMSSFGKMIFLEDDL